MGGRQTYLNNRSRRARSRAGTATSWYVAAMPSFTLGLTWKAPDGTATEEPWTYEGVPSLELALALARRDGIAGEFGRTFLGIADVAVLPEACAEPETHGPPLASIEQTPWWRYSCAFGPGTLVGVTLRRVDARDPETAREAAELAGACVAQQGTLYPATAPAIRAMTDLLLCEPCSARDTIAGWLEVVAASAHEALRSGDLERLRGRLVRALLRGLTPGFLVDELADSGIRHTEAARACLTVFRDRARELRPLVDRGVLGAETRRLLGARI